MKGKMIVVWLILIIIAGGICVYMGKFQPDWYNKLKYAFNINSANDINPAGIQYASYSNSLWFTPNTICAGSFTEANIDSNIPLGECSIFFMKGTWQFYDKIILDSNGNYKVNKQINSAGNVKFMTTCCDNDNNCKNSNDAYLNVNNCNQPQQMGCDEICLNSGYTSGYSNTNGCQQEYDPLMSSDGISCCCYAESSVPIYTCADSDGGQDDQYFTRGIVTSNAGTLFYAADECDWGTGKLWEYWCDSNKVIKRTIYSCENGWKCIEGKCAQPSCDDIMNPTSQADCAVGYTTDGGICSYWAMSGGNSGCFSSFGIV